MNKPNLAMVFDHLNHMQIRMDDLHRILQGINEDLEHDALNCVMGDLSDAGMALESIHANMQPDRCPKCGGHTAEDWENEPS